MTARTASLPGVPAAAAAPYLEVRGLWKTFGAFVALRDINLSIGRGEFVCFLGPSGCGKTTLLRAVAGLDPQTRGSIVQDGREVSALPASRRDYGIVFQSYALFPNMTVERNIAFGLENTGRPGAEIRARVAELLALIGLTSQAGKYPAQLSGGQQQRVALARALAISPGLLLLDEPLSALDAKVRVHLRHEIREVQRKLGVTTIMVTHDQEEALSMADRIVVMNHGVIEQVGTPTEIYRSPRTLFVADFIGETNKIPARLVAADRIALPGVELASAPAALAPGSAVVAAIRPVDIVPHAPESGAAPAAGNILDVRVAAMEYLGAFWRTRVMAARLGERAIVADFSINAVRRLGIAEGRAMRIEIPAERLLVFPAEA